MDPSPTAKIPPAPTPPLIKALSWLEIIWFFVLPWLAYWIVLESYEETPVGTALLGWAALIVYDMIKIGMILRNQRLSTNPLPRLLLILVPTAILAIAQWVRGGDLRGFIIELATLEFTVLVVSFAVALMTLTNRRGRSAWQDIGAIPLLIAVLFGFGIWGFITTWWGIAPSWETQRLSLLLLIAGAVIELVLSVRNLNQFAKGSAFLPDISSRPIVLALLLGQIVLWWLFPVLVNLIGKS